MGVFEPIVGSVIEAITDVGATLAADIVHGSGISGIIPAGGHQSRKMTSSTAF